MIDAIYINKMMQFLNKVKKENKEMKETLSFIANQKDKTGNWAVELAKRTLKDLGEI